jgi:hypothetical protein
MAAESPQRTGERMTTPRGIALDGPESDAEPLCPLPRAITPPLPSSSFSGNPFDIPVTYFRILHDFITATTGIMPVSRETEG